MQTVASAGDIMLSATKVHRRTGTDLQWNGPSKVLPTDQGIWKGNRFKGTVSNSHGTKHQKTPWLSTKLTKTKEHQEKRNRLAAVCVTWASSQKCVLMS